MSEAVTVNTGSGTPRIAVNVDGQTRYATYSAGTGTSSLTFSYAPTIGDLDLDGVALTSPIDLNGGTITDLNGNPETNLTFTVPNTSGVKVDYPSLSMDFTNGTSGRYTLNGTAYNDLSSFLTAAGGTFTRASVGTYFDSTGTLQTAAPGQPRFDHDPITHAPKGILIEESRTNLLPYSEDFSQWSKFTATVTSNAATAPDGTMTADLISANDTSLNNGFVYRNVTGNFTSYTVSVFAKAGNVSHFKIQPNAQIDGAITGFLATFDLSNQVATTGNFYGGHFINTSASISSVGNGWYKCSSSFKITGTTFDAPLKTWIYPYFAGDSVGSNVYIWGAQLEQGEFPTSYIPTATMNVTRAADVQTFPTSGWFNPNSASFYAQFQENAALNISGSGSLIMGTALDGRFIYRTSGSSAYRVYDGTNILTSPDQTLNSVVKVATKYGGSNMAISANGSLVTSNFDGSWGNQGFAWLANSRYNGWIANWKYYPASMSNTQLQLLTQ
ncbi:MAG: hypothetical protein RBR86_02030 [Pseudobdellovibrionaceae bacterium]|jgi:hypothetical protein|nr:hypothetical protein [Pseudobdellovibrionaceae bacterium]